MSTFYDFVCKMGNQTDKEVNRFVSFCKADKDFPHTNDPAALACYLYLKLDPKLTTAFQQLLMLYCEMHRDRLPKRAFARQDMALDTINLIISLQNASAEYKHWTLPECIYNVAELKGFTPEKCTFTWWPLCGNIKPEFYLADRIHEAIAVRREFNRNDGCGKCKVKKIQPE